MRVRLITTDRDPFWLIGNPARNDRDEMSQALDESIQITRNMQQQQGAEWDASEFFDRANQRLVLDATVRYQFASEWARMDFLSRLGNIDPDEQEHHWEGDIWLRNDLMGGTAGEFREWKIPNAVVALAGTKLDGAVGVRISYRITAGGFNNFTREGLAGVSVLANEAYGDAPQALIYGTAADGVFDTAETIYSGSISRALAVGERLGFVIGDNFGSLITKEFEVVNPGGSAGGGRIALTHPVVDNLDEIVAAFAAESSVGCFLNSEGARPFIYLGWKNAPISDPAEVPLNITISDSLGGSIYEAGSTAAAFNTASIPVLVTDDEDQLLVADESDF
jgi:hypothetical protein